MKKMVLTLAIIGFIAFSGFVGSAEQILRENSIYENSQVTFAGHGAVEDGPARTLLAVDKELSSKASSSTSGFSSETYISATSASAKNSKAPVTNVAPRAYIDSITPNPAPKGSSVTFKGSGTDEDGTIKTYLWTIDGSIVSTKASFSTSNIAAGTHTITFRVQDNAKKWSEPATAPLTVTGPNVAPVASIVSIDPSTATVGTEITFTGSGKDADGSIVAYRWTLEDGTELNKEPTFSTSAIPVGTHTITFSVQDNNEAWSKEVTGTLKITGTGSEVPSGTTVILTFDDGRKSDYTVVYQLLKDSTIRSTHYVIPSMVGADSTRMSWDDIISMQADGFDIECHSYTHSDLTKISTTQVIEEMLNVNKAFEDHGLPIPKHTAYPYGEYNGNVISAISQYRYSGRVVTWGQYSDSIGSLQKPYELPCYATDMHNTIAEIDKAIAGNYTLILGFHQVAENPPGPYDMSISEFTSILDHIESNNIPTQTISEYYEENFKT